jgi:CheY-like chemotaxis protein/signal transduction histidine kinase/HAMP domain-containing protein
MSGWNGGNIRFMKMGNLKIGTRLTIGFMLVIVMTLAAGGLGLRQIRLLAGLVTKMYNHPLTVGYAMRDIRSEIDRMHDQMQRLLFVSDAVELDDVARNIDTSAARVMDKFALVMKRFLGDTNDVVIARQAFIEWKHTLDQDVAVVRSGGRDTLDRDHFLDRLKRTDALQNKLQVMIDFAIGKAKSFLDEADRQHAKARAISVGFLAATLVLSLGIALVITRSIAPSLRLIVQRMEDIAKGDLDHDVEIVQKDEIGALADSFRVMRRGLHDKAEVAMAIASGDLGRQVQISGPEDHLGNAIDRMTLALQETKRNSDLLDWHKTGKNELNRIIVGQDDLKILAAEMLNFLANYVQAQVGTLYVLSKDGLLTLEAGYAVDPQHVAAPAIALGQGLVGQAAVEKKVIHRTDIPKDYFRINSSLGNSLPRQIVAVPLLFKDALQGVIELGSFEAFSTDKLDFLQKTSIAAAIAVRSVQNQTRRKELLEQTQQQARQLQAQEEELRVANEELEEQTRSLRQSREQLKQQQEELQAINEELEEKSQYLEEQKEQISSRNRALEVARAQLEQRAQELELASKYKSEFLANMSHELRTPLNSLLLLSRDLEENAKGNLDTDQVESAGVIHNSGGELLQLINEILDLSKIEAGQMVLKIDDVDLQETAATLKQGFKPVAAQKGLDFEIDMAEGLPASIRTDAQRLLQILKNLVSNALKFTDQGAVTVAIHLPAVDTDLTRSGLNPRQCVAFCVKDTGIGIPADKQMLVFEAFQQADGGTARKYGGTGLGLSIARELTKLLGGEMQLVSEVGQGSSFTLYLPREHVARTAASRADSPVAVRTRPPAPVRTSPAGVPENLSQPEPLIRLADDRERITPDERWILVIEDDANFAKILLEECRAKGFKAIVADSGEAGLLLTEQRLPEAILLDIRLPGMSGCTVLKTLKNNPKTRHIPVHIITVEETALENMQGGAIGFTTKPASRQDLEEVFENISSVVDKKIKDLLLVEDNPAMRRGIVKLIGDPEIQIEEVGSGAQVLAALGEKSFDCMILDLGLPDMSGFELLERIGAEPDLILPPVIVYTGRELSREEEIELRKYAETIIIKGVKSEERLLDEVSLFLHKTVSSMSPAKREMIITLHQREDMFSEKTILLVDDDMRNLFALSKILAERGLQVIKAEDGQKALALLDSHPQIALVLLDIMMPVMDGYQTAREIRKQARFRDLPIIALTAKALKDDRNKCIAAGANDYLAKPVDIERLISMLRVWLYRRECVL